MTSFSPATITVQRIVTADTLSTLLRSFDGLPNNPASLYLSSTAQNLVVYVAPKRTLSTISLPYLIEALRRKEENASALKSLLENGPVIKVFFDARKTAKILFDSCGITLSNPPCTIRAHIHEVQMLELALRQGDGSREWLAGLDQCIARDSDLEIEMHVPAGLCRSIRYDERILHLPVLWKKYHDRLLGKSFWVATIREATQKRLAVSCGGSHRGYSVDSARSAWDRDSIEEERDSWNDDVMMDHIHNGDWLGGAEHWAKFDVL
ncbi:hypothetical protein AA0117_g12853 [Alternaria alternata]|uniref:3'-5' exonuclease domain-containing protein n=1 Tax=Alternaria alternata TaxID=5599 RepID=A0A4Q4N0H4_ALTAL|nr:hypothetical protein AA0117_g12853 [Alternaria alternata]